MKSFKVEISKEGFKIHGFVQKLGRDLLISIWGGTQPHIGAVGMATPRPSLKSSKGWSATFSNFTFLNHKEDLLVKKISEKIASQSHAHVVVTAGLHWDNLTLREITLIERLTSKMGDIILKKLKANS
jgi:gallate decarboxylase subunit D